MHHRDANGPLPVQVEMYADGGARGGVLEAEGMVEIKFRGPDLRAAMARTDATVRRLKVGRAARHPIFLLRSVRSLMRIDDRLLRG